MIDLEDCKIWDGNRKIVLPRLTVNRGFYKIVKATPKAKAAVQQIVDAQRHVSALVAKL